MVLLGVYCTLDSGHGTTPFRMGPDRPGGERRPGGRGPHQPTPHRRNGGRPQGAAATGSQPTREGAAVTGGAHRRYYLPSIRLTWRASPGEKSVSRPSRRLRSLDLCSRRWERNALRRRSRPDPVTFTRLRAPLSVFIFGMVLSLSFALLVRRGLARRRIWLDGSRAGRLRHWLSCLRRLSCHCWSWHCRHRGCCLRGRGHLGRPAVPTRAIGAGSLVDRALGCRRLLRPLVRCQHHHHVPAIEPGDGLGFPHAVHLLGDPIEDLLAQLGMEHLTSAEHDGDLDLVALLEELGNLSGLGVEVTRADLRPVLHLLDPYVDRLAPRLLGPLGCIELEFPVVHDAADRRVGARCDLDEIEIELAGNSQRLRKRLDAKLLSVGIDQAHFTGADTVVDARFVCGDGGCYSTSLPVFGSRTSRGRRIRSGATAGFPRLASGTGPTNPAHAQCCIVAGWGFQTAIPRFLVYQLL